MTAGEYVQKVLIGEQNDPVISFLINVVDVQLLLLEKLFKNNMKNPIIMGYLMWEWKNPFAKTS